MRDRAHRKSAAKVWIAYIQGGDGRSRNQGLTSWLRLMAPCTVNPDAVVGDCVNTVGCINDFKADSGGPNAIKIGNLRTLL